MPTLDLTYDAGRYSANLGGPLGELLDHALNVVNTPQSRAAFEADRRLDHWDDDQFDREWASTLSFNAEVIANQFRIVTSRVPGEYRNACLALLHADQNADLIRRWTEDTTSKTLILHGPPGTGKTFAAYAVLNEAAVQYARVDRVPDRRNGPGPKTKLRTPLGISVASLLDKLRGDGDEALWDHVKNAQLLLLDDLGHVRATDWAVERIWMLADARCSEGRRTVVTTNAGFNDLADAWGLATMDRLRDRSVTAKFAGTSLRKPVTW